VRFHQGYFQEAYAYVARALAASNTQASMTEPIERDRAPAVGHLCRLATTLWFLGFPVQAQARQAEAVALARRLGGSLGAYDLLVAIDFDFALECYLRRRPAARRRGEELIALAAKYPIAHWETTAIIYRGWLLVEQGDSDAGIMLLRQGLETRQQKGIVMFTAELYSFLIEAYARASQFERALAVVTDALAMANSTGEQYWNAELHRLQGELLLAQGAAEDAVEVCLCQALEIARRQHAKSLELRAALSLARLWRDQGRQTEAYGLVAAIYGWFSEGFDTPDLQAAQAFLADGIKAA
jgi:adenylate cyclase